MEFFSSTKSSQQIALAEKAGDDKEKQLSCLIGMKNYRVLQCQAVSAVNTKLRCYPTNDYASFVLPTNNEEVETHQM